jgi:hypothetical protein
MRVNAVVLQPNAVRTAAIAHDFDRRLTEDEFDSADAAALHQGLHEKAVVNLVIARQKEGSGERGQLRLALPQF